MAKFKSQNYVQRLSRWRLWIQASFLLVWLDPLMVRMHTVCSPVFHCYSCPLATFACPIGVLANFSAIHVFPFMAVGVLVVTGVLLGGFVCGWICPFGFLQDLVGRIPTPKFQLPGWMGYMRFVVLVALVLAIPYYYGEAHPLFFCRVCPAGAVEAAVPNTVRLAVTGQEVVWPTAAKMSILGVFVVGMLFTWRPWCTAFCPLGAIFSLFNWVSIVFLRVDREQCSECDVCRSLCRYGSGPRQSGANMECIRCLDCTKCTRVKVSTAFQSQGGDRVDPNQLVTLEVGSSGPDRADHQH